MRRSLVRLACGLGLALSAAACAGGCTTAAVVSAGTMVGIAASAVSTGADVYQLGKLSSADEAHFDEWIAAVRAAADDLSLKVVKEAFNNKKGEWHCTLADERNATIKIRVQRRSETLCRTRIDVGWFGSEPTARLFIARVRQHEDPANTTGFEPM